MAFDLAVVETGNGGDLQIVGADLAIIYGIENMPYLGLFGGNPGFPTEETEIPAESFDWWGNLLLMPGNIATQFNSLFEEKLKNVPLTSASRLQLIETLKKDVAFMSDFAEVDISVLIVDTDRIQIRLGIIQEDGTTNITVVNFRKTADGDFVIIDFTDDFYL